MSNKAGSGRYQNGAARRKCKARHIAAEGPIPICPLCGKPIDLTLKTPHPLSCELDEIIPYSRGGSPTSYDNTQLTHRICNQRKSNKITTNTTGHQNTKNNHKTPSQSAANGNRGPYPPPPMQGSPTGPSAAVPPQSAWSIVRLAVGVPASARASRFGAGLTLLPRLFSRLLRLILRSFDMSRNYGCNPLEYML